MKKNDFIKLDGFCHRILAIHETEVFVINCEKKTMPKWIIKEELSTIQPIENPFVTGLTFDTLTSKQKEVMQKRYTYIAETLAVVEYKDLRNVAIKKTASYFQISTQTIKKYLWKYLIYQDITALAPLKKEDRELTQDEKNIRWGLNKFYYTRHKNSLRVAYRFLLRAKYYKDGKLIEPHPSFHQFYYFYKKHKKLQNEYIKREGLKNYQQDYRPLLGDSVMEYASHVGVGMFDSTICDIHLVDEEGKLVGRPVLTASIDAYSSLCMGYALTFHGGVQSLEDLLFNMITDKKDWCKKFGIKTEWNTTALPGVFLTDKGREYTSDSFSQLTELGITIVDLPAYRPDLKGPIEKFFDIIQESYKPMLKGKGVIEKDYLKRGSHDYRLDACLTLREFEKILLHCIIHYNEKRILKNYPYTETMLQENVAPFANKIFEFGLRQEGVQLIETTKEEVHFTLLPRTKGKFTKRGLKVHKMRYKNENPIYTEAYLKGGDVTIAYDPQDVTTIWLLEDGNYVPFELIERRYKHKTLEEVETLQAQKNTVIQQAIEREDIDKIELMNQIETVVRSSQFRKEEKHD